jgi:hypothetical protein
MNEQEEIKQRELLIQQTMQAVQEHITYSDKKILDMLVPPKSVSKHQMKLPKHWCD